MDIYTDGACKPNPGRGGWSFIILNSENLPEHVSFGVEIDTTNNRMELRAIIKALEYGLKNSECKEIEIFSDSEYCVRLCNKEVISIKKNQDMVSELYTLLGTADDEGFFVSFSWIKGHNGHPGNEFADFYANRGVE